jgi:hypothetical protein
VLFVVIVLCLGTAPSIVDFNKEFVVRLEDSIVQNNRATAGPAGGMILEAGNFSIIRTKIQSNMCDDPNKPSQGAGIYVSGSPFAAGKSTVVHVVGSQITKNQALGQNSFGGGVSVDSVEIGAPTNLKIKSCPRQIAADIKPPECNLDQPWAPDYGCSCKLEEKVFRLWSYAIEAHFEDSDVVSNEAVYGGG